MIFLGLDDVEITLLKAVLLQVICLYQQVVPHLVAQSNFDFSKLIKGNVKHTLAKWDYTKNNIYKRGSCPAL